MNEGKKIYHWYAVNFRGKKEEISSELTKAIEEKGFKEDIKEIKSGEPNLKNYFFIYCNLTPSLLKIFHKTKGILNFVNHRRKDLNMPDPVSPRLLENFFEKNEKFKKTKKEEKKNPLCDLRVKDWVRIKEGSFANYEARIVELLPKKKIKLLLDFLGETFLELDASKCEKII